MHALSPLHHREPEAGPETFNHSGGTPRSGVSTEDDTATNITPVDLKLYVPKGDSSDGGSTRSMARVEITFGKVQSQSKEGDA